MSIHNNLLLSLREDVPLLELEDGSMALESSETGRLLFKTVSPGIRQVLHRLKSSPSTERQLSDIVMQTDGMPMLMLFYQYLQRLLKESLLSHSIADESGTLVTIAPIARHYQFLPNLLDTNATYTLSRFAYNHRVANKWVLETPIGYAKLIFHDSRLASTLASLAQPITPAQLVEQTTGLDTTTIHLFLLLLLNAKAIVKVDGEQRPDEETDPTVAQWDFHDLLFHSRSRLGRHNNPYGGTFRFRGTFAPLPAIKPPVSQHIIPLHKPDLEQLTHTDPPFVTVLEQRRSIREYSADPITDRQLGEFLYRVARVKMHIPSNEGEMEYTLRPYPGGGAIHELEIYPLINKCQGIPSGLYHYNPLEHQLHKIEANPQYIQALTHIAWITADRKSEPQIYFAITARFQRVQWKYESMVYALILKHVGVLYQTMYMVATAMGLAPCALGGGNSDLFSLTAGLDYLTETEVGEFVLGSRQS